MIIFTTVLDKINRATTREAVVTALQLLIHMLGRKGVFGEAAQERRQSEEDEREKQSKMYRGEDAFNRGLLADPENDSRWITRDEIFERLVNCVRNARSRITRSILCDDSRNPVIDIDLEDVEMFRDSDSEEDGKTPHEMENML